MKISAIITLKKDVLDPQGKVIHQALDGMGFANINEVRQGKYFEINVKENDPQKAKKVYKLLGKKNINTGILPIASRWHYAGYWNHLWPKMKKNKKNFSKIFWRNTWNILSKSISIQIPILENKLQIEKKARIISAVINKI